MTHGSKPVAAKFVGLLLLATLAAPRPATAEGPNLLAFGIGVFDVVRLDEPAANFRLEYRHSTGLWIFQLSVGLEATSDGAIFGVAGLFSAFPAREPGDRLAQHRHRGLPPRRRPRPRQRLRDPLVTRVRLAPPR